MRLFIEETDIYYRCWTSDCDSSGIQKKEVIYAWE